MSTCWSVYHPPPPNPPTPRHRRGWGGHPNPPPSSDWEEPSAISPCQQTTGDKQYVRQVATLLLLIIIITVSQLNPQAAPKFGGCQKVFRTSSSLTLPSSLSSQEMPIWQRSAFLETDETNSKPLKSEPDVTVVDEISSGCNLQYLIIIECNAPDHTSYWFSVHTIADRVQQTIRRWDKETLLQKCTQPSTECAKN